MPAHDSIVLRNRPVVLGMAIAIYAIAALTPLSRLVMPVRMYETLPTKR